MEKKMVVDVVKQIQTINLMQQHRSIRTFKEEKIAKEKIKELIRSGQAAASSHFVQAYSVILIEDQEKRDKIAEVARQKQVKEAPVFLLFCADLKRLEHAANMHDAPFVHDTAENVIVASVDTALMAQNVLLAAESMGLGGCYVGGVRNDLHTVSEVVGLPDKVFPLFGMTLGIPDETTDTQEVKPRLPIDAILHEDQYQESKYEEQLKQFDETMKAYYASRSQNNKSMTWTKAMAEFLSEPRRGYLSEFLKSKGFTFK